uniref:Exocyst complex component 3-like 1 n=1 Tax=Scleropages formosus TaxID=113540 RepID=A0A8C9VPX1_SCLFO
MEVWPELERAECLARGAALKWASGVFSHPEQLERLSQYRKRESQRTESIHSRLKSMVQSYLEGVGWGLEQLREARVELKEVSRSLAEVRLETTRNAERVAGLVPLREVSVNHRQLLAATSNLPHLYAVRGAVLETERLVESRRLLEAHARLMELERWQDEVLWQLYGAGPPDPCDEELVREYFSGVGRLVDALAKELWAVVGSGLTLARQNPTPFVSVVRIVEREEALDRALLEERGEAAGSSRPLPSGRPRCWRKRFFQVMEESISSRFRSVSYLHTRGPGLAGHLSALQHSIMGDLATVQHLLEHCVPPHYRLARAYLRACHRCLQAHLAQVSSWELESGEIFAVLNWVLHVYRSPEMMGHSDLVSEFDPEELGPLISQEALDSVSEWMHKALEVELTDWQRDQEPDTDHEGFYQTSLPTIITQMLQENARVALMISDSLRDRIIQMGLYELESFLNRYAAQVLPPLSDGFHLQLYCPQVSVMCCWGEVFLYTYTCVSLYILFHLMLHESRSSTESLQEQRSSCPAGRFPWTPPGPLAALDRVVKKACRLVMDELLLDLQPLLLRLMSGSWLAHGEITPLLCGVLEQHCELYTRVRPPCRQRLQEECQWLIVVEYVQALMQKRLVCKGVAERVQVGQRITQDAQLLRDLFQGLEGEGIVAGFTPGALLPVLAEFIQLKDPNMLTLEVSGLASKYPDISTEHVSVLLDIRGDVPRDVRVAVLDMLEQSAPPLPPGYRALFSDIPVPPRSMPFCLPTAKCA